MLDNTALSELKIRELRSYSEKKLGKRFDIREFHDVVLESGCVPLPIIEKRVKAWTESVEKAQ